MWTNITFDKIRCLPLRTSLINLQANKVKYYTNPKQLNFIFQKILVSSFQKSKYAQLKFQYVIFTECINLYHIGEKFSNTKKPTISPLPEHHYRSNFKLRTNNFFVNFRRRNLRTNRLNEVIIQLGKLFDSYRRESHNLVYKLLANVFNIYFLNRLD